MELTTEVGAEGAAYVITLLHSPVQIAATLAAAVGIALVVFGSFVRTMLPLRWERGRQNFPKSASLTKFRPETGTCVFARADDRQ